MWPITSYSGLIILEACKRNNKNTGTEPRKNIKTHNACTNITNHVTEGTYTDKFINICNHVVQQQHA